MNDKMKVSEMWKGHRWITIKNDPFELKVAESIEKFPAVELFVILIPQVIDNIVQVVPLSKYTRKVKIALFPRDSYRDDLKLEEFIPDWVQVCRRDGITCYDISIATSWRQNLSDIPPEHMRELIHELGHEVHPFLSSDYLWTPLAIREGGVEVMARLLAKIQPRLSVSTQYIGNKLRQELIDPETIEQEGLFAQSKEPLDTNCGYLSATAYVAGLCSLLGNNNLKKGFQEIKSMAEKEQDQGKFLDRLNKRLNGIINSAIERKNIQLLGINELLR